MSPKDPRQVQVGDRVRFRKMHPCGGFDWEVTRIGADIGVRCLTCGRYVMIPRSRFERRAKAVFGVGEELPPLPVGLVLARKRRMRARSKKL